MVGSPLGDAAGVMVGSVQGRLTLADALWYAQVSPYCISTCCAVQRMLAVPQLADCAALYDASVNVHERMCRHPLHIFSHAADQCSGGAGSS